MFSLIDDKLRYYFSFLYRFIVVVYGIIILQTAIVNLFPIYVYTIIIVSYGCSFILFKIYFNNGLLRLFTDVIFISLILFGKDITLNINYLIIVLPLINSPNYSGKKAGFIIYFVVLVEIFVLSKFALILNSILPLFAIFCIEFFIRIRDSVKKINEILFEIIDSFYAKNITNRESNKIYKHLLTKLSERTITKNLNINSIICFVVKDNEFVLVNSSTDVLLFEIPNSKSLIEQFGSKSIVENEIIKIDQKEFKENLFARVKGNQITYIFLIAFGETESSFLQIFRAMTVTRLVLVPSLKHLARLFEIQQQINDSKTKSLEALQNNQEYVLKANEVMHFVKNSLSPIKSVLTISELYFSEENQHKKEYLKEAFVKQRKQALQEVKNIIDRSDFILEKSKNPFEATKIADYGIFGVFYWLRRRWSEIYSPNTFTVLPGTGIDLEKARCSLDFDILYLIVSNIMANMESYGGEKKELNFKILKDKLELSFINNVVIADKDIEKLKKLITHYNENKRIEINKRKSHGFAHLKIYLESTGASSLILLKGKIFTFTLILPIKYESSDI